MSPTNVTTDERAALRAAIVVAGLLIGQLVAAQALRDGFLLSHFEPTVLPTMVTVAALLSIAYVLLSSRILRRFTPSRVLPTVLIVSGVLYVGEWWLAERLPRIAAVALYLHSSMLAAATVSAFWSVVNERFDPHAAKQMIGRIGSGATFGGLLGGFAIWRGAEWLDVSQMILVIGLINLACAVASPTIGRSASTEASDGSAGDSESKASAIEIFQQSSYLRRIALLVALISFSHEVYDFVFKSTAVRYFESGPELVSFFGLFYLGLGVLTFLTQSLATRPALERLGLPITLGMLPAGTALLGLSSLVFPGLTSALAVRAGLGVGENSLFRSSYELLYTPVLPERKRPTKPLIDIGGDKLGMAAGGALAFLIVGGFPEWALPVLICLGIGASLYCLRITRELHDGYVSSLADRLRAGTLRSHDLDVQDATTQRALADEMATLDDEHDAEAYRAPRSSTSDTWHSAPDLRSMVQKRVQRRLREEEAAPASPAPWRPEARPELSPSEVDPTLRTLAELRSGDARRIEAALLEVTRRPSELFPSVIPLLANEEVADAAAETLRRVGPAQTGSLLDAALSSRTPVPIRRRLCEILARIPTVRAMDGLVRLLNDRDFEMRFRAARALLQLKRSSPNLPIPQPPLFEVAEREARDCERRWRRQTAVDPRLTESASRDSDEGRRVIQGMTMIGTLLLAVLEAEPLRLAILALAGVPAERGTGLEYLENVLPKSLFTTLRPLLMDRDLIDPGLRARAEILAELSQGRTAAPVDLQALRVHIDAARARRAAAQST